MRTVVIGSGSWGTALAQVLQDNHQEVLVYGVAKAEVNDINENHKNSKYFGDVELNPELKATTDIECVKGADIVLLFQRDSIQKQMKECHKLFVVVLMKIN